MEYKPFTYRMIAGCYEYIIYGTKENWRSAIRDFVNGLRVIYRLLNHKT